MPNFPFAKYSISFKEFLDENATWVASNIAMSTTDRTNFLLEALRHMWEYYEISGETIGEFKMFFKDTFELHKAYYEEMITNYDKTFAYENGISRTVENYTEGKSINVDLPNKVINADDIYKYPSSGDKGNTSATTTYTNPELFLKLKNQYLRQVRNLYNEFAMKFSDCFIHLF